MGAATDAELLARAVRNPCRLVLAPATTTGAFPYGGTSLGFISDVELDWDVRYYESRDPASGVVAEITRRSAEVPRIACLLQGSQWDTDVLQAVFTQVTGPASLAYTSPQETRIEGTVIPAVVPAWTSILLAALDPQQFSVLVRRPVPRLSLRQSVALSQARGAGLPIVFVPTPDSANATIPYWQICRLENMKLS